MHNLSSIPHCSFCARDLANVEFLFRAPIGGEPPHICGACVEERMAWIMMDRKMPGFLAAAIEVQKAKIAAKWAESHPGNGAATREGPAT